jgi:hypothetical protein
MCALQSELMIHNHDLRRHILCPFRLDADIKNNHCKRCGKVNQRYTEKQHLQA